MQPTGRKRRLLSFFPLLISFCGILFSWDVPHPWLQGLIVLVSVAAPVASSVNFFGHYRTRWAERAFYALGCALLAVLGVASVAGVPDTLARDWTPFGALAEISQAMGLLSLLLGLGVVVFLSVRSESDLEDLGERFRQLADLMNEGFLLCGPDGAIRFVNQRLLDMLALSELDLKGKRLHDIEARGTEGPARRHTRTRPQGETATEYELCIPVRHEPCYFAFSEMAIRNPRGEKTGILATVRDVTEQHRLAKRVERYAQGLQRLVEEQTQKLQHYEDRYRRLLLSMNEGFLTLDAANSIRMANGRICRLLRLELDDIRGRSIFDFVEGPGRMRLLNILARGKEVQGAEARLELDFVSARGERIPTVIAVSHIGAEDDWESVFSMVVTNVTELKQTQKQSDLRAQELERVNEELRMHGRARDAFLSNVTHELRTPLSTIAGYVEMLDTGSLGPLEAAQHGALKVMQRNAQRLESHINELIEFSRMEIQGIQLVKRLFSPLRLVQEATASIHPLTHAKGIEVATAFPEDLPHYAWGDRDRLGQVLGILLNNAVKFTGKGGRIGVRIETGTGDLLRIIVQDTGIGIDTIHQEQIFKKFFQVDSSKTRRFEGTGIGLSIANTIVQAHEGTISVQSALGQGSTFTVALPNALFRMAHDPADVAGFESLRVIAVNSETGFDETVCQFLREHVGTLLTEKNGYQCVRMAEEQVPDLILINDLQADDDTAQLVRHLREQPATAEVPIVVFCGEVLPDYRELATIQQDVYFVLRPFDIYLVIDRIRLACFGEQGDARLPAQELRGEARPSRPHVLFIDADPGLLEWVEMVLHLREVACCCAPTAAKAIEMIDCDAPDVVFLDGDQPLQLVAEQVALLHEHEATRAAPIFLCADAMIDVQQVPKSAGTLQKPFTVDDLVACIETARASRGSRHVSAEAVP